MSTTVLNELQVGTSSTASDNVVLAAPLSPDGSMAITRGSRNGSAIASFNANDTITLNKPISTPDVQYVSSNGELQINKSVGFSYTPSAGAHTMSFMGQVPSGVAYTAFVDLAITAGSTTYTTPTLVSSTSFLSANKTNSAVVVSKPTVQVGDLIVVMFTYDGSSPTFTPPAGWAELNDPGGQPGPYVAYRFVTGTEGTSFTFTGSGSGWAYNGTTIVVRGLNTSATPLVASSSSGTTGVIVPTTSSIVIAVGSTTSSATPTNGGTTIYSSGAATECGFGAFTQGLTLVGPAQTTIANATQSVIFSFAAASTTTAGPTLTWPSEITWQDGALPPVEYSGTFRTALTTYNGGTSWAGSFIKIA